MKKGRDVASVHGQNMELIQKMFIPQIPNASQSKQASIDPDSVDSISNEITQYRSEIKGSTSEKNCVLLLERIFKLVQQRTELFEGVEQ